MTHAVQTSLFESGAQLPNGFIYRPRFLTENEEQELVAWIDDLPLEHGRLGEYIAKRRVIGFGWGYDFRTHTLVPGPPLPPPLHPVARKIAKWLDIPYTRIAEALVQEYPKGAGIGWHRDNEQFEHIVGISLSGQARMRLRPMRRMRVRRDAADVIALTLAPRSAYVMQHASRWDFQHSVAPVAALRYSITFRTLPPGTTPATPRESRRR